MVQEVVEQENVEQENVDQIVEVGAVEQKVVYRAFACHLCEDYNEFNDGSALRKHLKNVHDIIWEGKAGKRPSKDGIQFISKKERENFAKYTIWYMCTANACSNYYQNMEGLKTHISYNHTVVVAPNKQPLKIPIPEIAVTLAPAQKRRSVADINERVFRFKTQPEREMVTAVLKSFNVGNATLEFFQSEERQATMNVVAAENDLKLLQSFNNEKVTVKAEVSAEDQSSPISPGLNTLNDHFVHSCLQQSYPCLLKHQRYQEIDDAALNILNTDWSLGAHMRIAAGTMLAGAILVDNGQALLINCVETYNRKPSIDPHHERFGSQFMVSSLPTLSHRYQRISIINKVEDKSKKLIIGTLVFNALVTSSIRLDINLPAEVGASTFAFNPSNNTQLFLSSRSIESANKAIAHKTKVYALHDFNCSLRQVRSRLTSPDTYAFARFHTEWTHYNDSMPYTIFTIADKPNADRSNSSIACARVLSMVAAAMRFNDGNIDKSDILDIMTGVKDSAAKATMTDLVNLFGDEGRMNIIGNQEIESLLMNLASICTNELKTANDNIKTGIIAHLKNL